MLVTIPEILGHHWLSHMELAGTCAPVMMGLLCALFDLHMVFDVRPQQVNRVRTCRFKNRAVGKTPVVAWEVVR